MAEHASTRVLWRFSKAIKSKSDVIPSSKNFSWCLANFLKRKRLIKMKNEKKLLLDASTTSPKSKRGWGELRIKLKNN